MVEGTVQPASQMSGRVQTSHIGEKEVGGSAGRADMMRCTITLLFACSSWVATAPSASHSEYVRHEDIDA